MKSLMIFVFAGLLFSLVSVNYHFILFDDNLTVIRKDNQKFENTLVDARGTKSLRILLMPDLMAAGIRDQLRGRGESFNLKLSF